MLDLLMLSAALLQAQAASPCNAVPLPSPPPANCQAWEPLATHPEANTFVDHATVRREGNWFEIGLRTVFPRPGPGGAVSVNSTMRFDCQARTAVVARLRGFDPAGVEVMSGAPSGEMAVPRPVPAGSPTEGLLARHCRR